jgi:hypothetical protein
MADNALPTIGSITTPLEDQVMKDYGKYVYKAVDVPAFTPPTRRPQAGMGNFGMGSIGLGLRNPANIAKAKEDYDKDLANLGSALPSGVRLVGTQLQIDPSSSLYSLDPTKTNFLAEIRNQAAKEAQLRDYNAKLAASGQPTVSALPSGLGANIALTSMKIPTLSSYGATMGAPRNNGFMGMGSIGLGLSRGLNKPYDGPLDILGGNYVPRNNYGFMGNMNPVGMGSIGLGLRNRQPNLPQVTEVQATRNMDEALAEYLRLQPGMTIDQLRAQQDAKRAAMGNIQQNALLPNQQNQAVVNQYTQEAQPQQINDMLSKYTQPQQGFAEGGAVHNYAIGGPARGSITGILGQERRQPSMASLNIFGQRENNQVFPQNKPRSIMDMINSGRNYVAAPAVAVAEPEITLAEYENRVKAMRDAAYAELRNKYAQQITPNFARGGSVHGYAEGGEYDPENPDFASQVQANMAANPLYAQREVAAPVQIAAPVAALSPAEEALGQRRQLMLDLNKALTAQNQTPRMSDAEKYFRLAAAFAKPTKTGHFGESIANVGETYADIGAIKRQEEKDIIAQNLQRLQARSELAGQQYTLSREAEMQDLLKKYVNKGQSVTGEVASGASDDGIPAEVKALILAQPTEKAVATIIDMAKEANKPSDLVKGVRFLVANGAISKEEGAQIVKENLQGKLEQLDVAVPELGGTFKLTGPEARAYYADGTLPSRLGGETKPATVTETAPTAPTAGKAKVAADVNNPSGIRKDGQFVAYNTPSEGIAATHGLVGRYLEGKGPMKGIPATPENVVGVWTSNDPTMGAKVMGGSYASAVRQELTNMGIKLNADGTIPNTPMAATAVSNAIIKNESGNKASKFLGGPSKETVPAGKSTTPMSQEQMEAKKTGMVEQAKKDIEASDSLLSQKSFAKQQKDAAKLVLGYANKSPKSFGVIAEPNWQNAVANLLETGVNTPFGSFGLAVEEPIAKLKLTGPEASVRQLSAAPIALIEVGYRKLYLKGEGAVSNMEGALTKYIGPQLSDSARTVQLKAGMIAIGAEKQEKIVEAFERYKESHPEAGPRSFYQTPEFKQIRDSYETKYAAFAKANNIPIEGVESAPAKGSSFAEGLKAERARRQGNK